MKMNNEQQSIEKLLASLRERAKELNCLYKIEEVLSNPNYSLGEMLQKVVAAIPTGWQYPNICKARLVYGSRIWTSPNFKVSPWLQRADITVQDNVVGSLEVYYIEERSSADEGPFLKEERKLINTIADRLGHYLLYRKLRQMFTEWDNTKEDITDKKRPEWLVILELIKRTDQPLFNRISRKMMNYLSRRGISDASVLLQEFSNDQASIDIFYEGEVNQPVHKTTKDWTIQLSNKIFEIAEKCMEDSEILSLINKWMQEDKAGFLVRSLESQTNSLNKIAAALMRFYYLDPHNIELSEATRYTLVSSLIRRFLSDHLEYINIAKEFINIKDFYELTQRIIFPSESHGKLGGKSAGLFLASLILKKMSQDIPILENIRVPKTWYIASDGIWSFIHYNDLEEVFEQKYKSVEQIKQEYPHITQLFKNSQFPPEILKGVYMALEDFGDKPLIVRSSSLLEDRLGTAFSGKYKSLFLANIGSKEERLSALLDAIAEVYASTFGPDPIEYRAKHGLLDFHEEMGIMIQEVVGQQVDGYFFPAFAGVAFSNNELRWSPRVRREDGLIRLVPGLGTRAVDRLSDDYPILIAPGQPGLKVNTTIDENIRYSPQKIDLINLKKGCFETRDIKPLIQKMGNRFPAFHKIISIITDHHLQRPNILSSDLEKSDFAITFDGLIADSNFISIMNTILDQLKKHLNTPVDIEFASDGNNFYLLQCRPQSYSEDSAPAPIPKEIHPNKILFTANRYVPNGNLPDISHVVYVDPDTYSNIQSLNDLKMVGRVVGKLNKILPKRRFILLGPGRWGSRGDIKLGVSVTYADISNTAMLIEIARKKGNYVPDLSFGTHFFQDLVESRIRYLPLYPDEKGVIFNEWLIKRARNLLPDLLPSHKHLADVVYVVDFSAESDGQILQILMNADLNEAVAFLSHFDEKNPVTRQNRPMKLVDDSDEHWRWRMNMVEKIAARLDPKRFGVKAFYVFGSTLEGTARAGSDVDVIIHFQGTPEQRRELELWLEGWSQCLSEVNYMRSGYKSSGLLDYHILTDEDFARKDSFAMRVHSSTNPVRELKMGIKVN